MNKTCVVMGNGQSLLTMPDLPYETFGVNYIGLLRQPTYYVCVDTHVLLEHASLIFETAKNAKKAFLNAEHGYLYKLPNYVPVERDTAMFSEEQYMSGYTAVYVALKMAYYEGFKRVFLYGVDHTREWEHFTEDYPTGVVTTEIRRDVMWWHYRYANEVYKKDGRQIINCSAPSPLDKIFPRC